MHVFKSRFLRRGEVWFDQEADRSSVDWIYYRQLPHPVAGAKWTHFYTLLVNLKDSPEALMKACQKSAKYSITRARDLDGFRCECPNPVTPSMLHNFAEEYKDFAARK